VMQLKRFHLNVIARISMGLVALILSLILIADVFFNIFPRADIIKQQQRALLVENLAMQLASLIEAKETTVLNKTILHITANQEDVLSIGIRKSNGWLAYASNNHTKHWKIKPLAPSTIDYMRTPLYSGSDQWGDIEVSFQPAQAGSLLSEFNGQLFTLLGLSLLSTILIYFYLRRALHYLSPSKTVPTRVHDAFDIIADSILLLDKDGKIVLANAAFKKLDSTINNEYLYGKRIDEVQLTKGLATQLDKGSNPWEQPFNDITFRTNNQDREILTLLASCAPVLDESQQSRGFLITLKNITELHETNQKLSETLQELKVSRAKLELNNEQLQEMAYRDSLTGCLNRRAFFQKAEDLYTLASQGNRELFCVMADIDFFKSFNDIYGHYVGDQVIQIVAKILTSKLRPSDLICRYGGEEFCILITDVTQQQALEICERMRSTIEDTANKSLRNEKVKQITASFGIASINSGARSIENLIDYADSALYVSKESGRNQVNQWLSSMVE